MGEHYLTKKKRKLTGKRLETFNKFWDIFNYKEGKADAADAWLDIPTLTDAIVVDIMLGAKNEAMRRHRIIDSGRTPKMAQGWLTARRWEDETGDVERIPPYRTPGNGYDNMVRAFNILTNISEDKFHEFCANVKMPSGDKEAVLYKYHVGFNGDKLASGSVKGV